MEFSRGRNFLKKVPSPNPILKNFPTKKVNRVCADLLLYLCIVKKMNPLGGVNHGAGFFTKISI